MPIIYKKGNNQKSNISYEIFDEDNFVGSVEAAGNTAGEFLSVVMIDPNYHGKGVGFDAFKKVFAEINKNYPISKIIGSWHKNEEYTNYKNGMSTNMRIFQQCAVTHSDDESAANTPTGKWAKKLGFGNCKIISKSDQEVVVHFTK